MVEEPEDQKPTPLGPSHSRKGQPHLDRRRFIGLTAAGGVAAAAAALGIADAASGDDHPAATGAQGRAPARGKRRTASTAEPPAPSQSIVELADGIELPISPAIVAENAKVGDAWWVDSVQVPRSIEGYASQVSAVAGETVTLFVNTTAPQFHVEAYRMGYYQGIGGRLVWRSEELTGVQQPPPQLLPFTNTVECSWAPSLTVAIDAAWPPGAYLLKLVGVTGEQQFVPLCVRDDTSQAAVVLQHSVTTWQAYNRWGGFSLYYGNPDGMLTYAHAPGPRSTYNDRARIVSFDRPYDHDWASGAADFVGNELPVSFQAEQLGLDVTYWTDIDLHTRPQLLDNHRGLVSLGHDEYWSAPMRDGAAQSLAKGVNLAFLGANACYRQIRLEPSALGPNRRQVCYKSAAEDPMTGQNNTLVTVNWEQRPVDRPESELIGSTYQDIGANADLVITDPTSWLLAGTGLHAGQGLPEVVQGEFDRYVPDGQGPTNLDVIAHSPVANRNHNYSDITWYTVDGGGGGVFATGNAWWVAALSNSALIPPDVIPVPAPEITIPLLRIMQNLYAVIGLGPASISQPSQGNWRTVYSPGSPSSAAPNTINAA
jgi:hypothetical protein